MATDPNRPPGLPQAGPGGAPDPVTAAAMAATPPVDPAAAAAGGPPQPSFPTTDPQSMMGVLQAMRATDQAQFEQQQNGALGMAVEQLLRQTPNVAGEAATSLPGGPAAPPLPGQGPGGAGDPMAGLGAGSGY